MADETVLKHLVRTEYPARLHVLAETFNIYYISMAMPPGSRLREPLNRSLLGMMAKDEWGRFVKRYLGSGS